MERELTMPRLSDSMADAVILRWLKSPGQAFERGEGLIEVETDKATVVYEAEAGGTLGSILAAEGTTVAVGAPIATLVNGGAAAAPEPQPGAGPRASRPNATPVARRTAVELGVSLHGIAGTGPGGRITVEDVRLAATDSRAPVQQPALGGRGETRVLELTPTQATIARRMVESATTIPCFTVSSDVDMSLIAALRRGARDERDGVPSVNDFVVKAAAAALLEFPRFNASFADGGVECYSRINVGVAVATDDALLVPVVFDADRKTLSEIAADCPAACRRRAAPSPPAGRPARRHVHRLEPRHVRRPLVHRDHRPSAGRDSRRRQRSAGSRRRRLGRRRLPRRDDGDARVRSPGRLRRRRCALPVPATRAARAAARPHPALTGA